MRKEPLTLLFLLALEACASPSFAPEDTPVDLSPPTAQPPTQQAIVGETPSAIIFAEPAPPREKRPVRSPTPAVPKPAWCNRTPVAVGAPGAGGESVTAHGSSFTQLFLRYVVEDWQLAREFSGITISGNAYPEESTERLMTRFIDVSSTITAKAGSRNILLLQLGAMDLINGKNATTVLADVGRDTDAIGACFPEFELVLVAPIVNQINPIDTQLSFAAALQLSLGGRGIRVANPNPLLITPDGGVRKELYADPLHLKPEGYRLIAPVMRQAIIDTN